MTQTAVSPDYRNYIRKKWLALLALAVFLLVSCTLSVCAGSSGLSPQEILLALLGNGDNTSSTIVWNVRMPRIATGAAVGAALALAGCVMQNVLRNPLASASTLGVSQGASFGAAVAIVYLGGGVSLAGSSAGSITVTNPYLVTLCAFLGGVATTAVILLLSRMAGASHSMLILAGVAISSLFTGATTLIQYFCDDVTVSTIVYWTFGSLGRTNWREIALIALLCAAAFFYFFANRWNYNALEGGVSTATSLGVSVPVLVLVSLSVCALIASVSVAFVGCINFIGLLAPHIARRAVGSDHRFLLPAAPLVGACLMLWADMVSRTIAAPTVLPIGALTSFLGAPLFLYLIVKRRAAP